MDQGKARDTHGVRERGHFVALWVTARPQDSLKWNTTCNAAQECQMGKLFTLSRSFSNLSNTATLHQSTEHQNRCDSFWEDKLDWDFLMSLNSGNYVTQLAVQPCPYLAASLWQPQFMAWVNFKQQKDLSNRQKIGEMRRMHIWCSFKLVLQAKFWLITKQKSDKQNFHKPKCALKCLKYFSYII